MAGKSICRSICHPSRNMRMGRGGHKRKLPGHLTLPTVAKIQPALSSTPEHHPALPKFAIALRIGLLPLFVQVPIGES